MTPQQALEYLDTCAAAFLKTLPAPAAGPTQQAVLAALAALRPLVEASAQPKA